MAPNCIYVPLCIQYMSAKGQIPVFDVWLAISTPMGDHKSSESQAHWGNKT